MDVTWLLFTSAKTFYSALKGNSFWDAPRHSQTIENSSQYLNEQLRRRILKECLSSSFVSSVFYPKFDKKMMNFLKNIFRFQFSGNVIFVCPQCNGRKMIQKKWMTYRFFKLCHKVQKVHSVGEELPLTKVSYERDVLVIIITSRWAKKSILLKIWR